MSGEQGTNGGPPTGDASSHMPAIIAKVVDPPGATAATVTLLQRAGDDVICDQCQPAQPAPQPDTRKE